MTPLPTPRRLLTLDALLARHRPLRAVGDDAPETRLPDEAELAPARELARSQLGRLAAEVALEEGAQRQYAPRGESQVLERR